MIYRAPELDERERAVVGAIECAERQVRGHLLAPAVWSGTTAREVYLATLRAGGQRNAGSCMLPAEVSPAMSGYRRAMSYVLQRFDDSHFKYSDELLRALHFMLTEHDQAATPGRWRLRAGGVLDSKRNVVYRGPEADRIRALIDELLAALNTESEIPALVRGAIAHLNVLRIHPFRDGNGRLARCLEALVVARAGYRAPGLLNVEEYCGYNRMAYERALASTTDGEWQPENDTRVWLRFSLTMRYRQALNLLKDFRNFSDLYSELSAKMSGNDHFSWAAIAAGEMLHMPLPSEPTPWQASRLIDQRAGLNSAFRFERVASGEVLTALPDLTMPALLEQSRIEAGWAAPDPFA